MPEFPSPPPSVLLPEQPLEQDDDGQDYLVSPVTTDDESMAPGPITNPQGGGAVPQLPRVTWTTDRLQDAGVEPINELERQHGWEKIMGNVEVQATSGSTSHKTKMDDDSLGLRSASGSPQEPPCSQREPEGTVSRHAIRESRRFSDDFQNEIMKVGDGKNKGSNGEVVTPTTNRDLSHSSPPAALKEISISRDVQDDGGGLEEEGESDDMEHSINSPLRTDSFLRRSPARDKSPHSKEDQTTHHDVDSLPLNTSMEAPPPREALYKPPSSTDFVPLESDLSVFSVHSGYAIHDQNGLQPRIVPGTMVHSSTPHHPYPANIAAHIHHPQQGIPTQHSLGSTNGYPAQHYLSHYGGAPLPPPVIMGPPSVGKRKVHFRLVEDIPLPTTRKPSFLSFRRPSHRSLLTASPVAEEPPTEVDRGRVTVSWYEGTTTLELMEHVRTAVIRKLDLQGSTKLADLRILEESTSPPEEIVLTPFIPSGSRLLLRFTTRDARGDTTPPYGQQSSYGGAPVSPSAAPSPHLSKVDLEGLGLSSNQLALLGARLKSLQIPSVDGLDPSDNSNYRRSKKNASTPSKKNAKILQTRKSEEVLNERTESPDGDKDDGKDDQSSVFELQSLHPEDQIQKSLQNITQLLTMERERMRYYPMQEKRQVIFIIANYFVLFISLIAISAEIQARAPGWNAAIEQHLNSVKNCSKDQDALFECVSNGDFSGLVASVVLFLSRSAATKRIFLFGFDSPRKLWTVVYESFVTAVCWGFSYVFIRRGMNPDTNRNFLQKYWKDAMYGSLAGFNAAFMKHVLKNLVPQEAIEDALHERRLKFLSWLPSFA